MSRVLHAACSTPWWITPTALETVLEIAAREHEVSPEAIERMRGERLEDARRVRMREGVAIIPVQGPIFRYANLFTAFSGATSSEVLANDIGTALRDPDVKSIILEIDSPGGMVNGTGELAKLIYNARGEKPIVSFISGMGASAAYYVASAADRVLADRSAIVGSIGTILEVVDFKKMDEKRGIRAHTFVSAQSPKKRLDPFDEDPERRDEARDEIQTLVNDLAQVFIEDVARNRGISTDTVLDDFGMGGVFVGEAALEAGMVDGITTLEDLISESTQDRRSRGSAGLRPAAEMQTPRKPSQEESMADAAQQPAAAQQPVIDRAYLEENHGDLVAELQAEGATAERERILAIQKLAGPEDVRAECIESGLSAGEAALKILAAHEAKEEARARAHLDERAATEDAAEKPGPDVGATGASDERSRAKQVVSLYNRLKGRESASAA